MKKLKFFIVVPFIFALTSCSNLSPEANDRLANRAIDIMAPIVIRATK